MTRCTFVVCIALLTTLLTPGLYASGFATSVKPVKIEVVRGQGVMVFGEFGNPNNCTAATGFWIKIEHPQYEEMYSMALTAMTAGMRLQPYLRECDSIGWYGGTWNTVTGLDSMSLLPAA